MKSILGFVAVCFTAAVLGCQTSQTVSPGALGSDCGAKAGAACTKDKSECCGSAKCDGTSLSAVSDCASKCASKCADKADCATKCAEKCASKCSKEADASMGAVSEKAGCHHNKTDCQKRCPATGAAGTSCTKEADASLGAVSEKAGCGVKRSCGAKRSGCGSN